MLEPGVSRALARERAVRVSSVRYELHFTIPADLSAPIPASAAVSFVLKDNQSALAFDFAPDHAIAPSACEVNGVGCLPAIDNEHLVIPSERLRRGVNDVRLSFVAGNVPLNRRADHLYSIFVPARARETFPCFDQPDLRARFALTLDVADGWMAVSNAELADVSSAGGRTVLTFADTAPLPTYLFAFAAGRLLEDVAERDGREFRVYHTVSESESYPPHRDAIVDGHARALAWLEEYTGAPYPFGKFDIVILPAFQFGGMEHPGAIFYNAATILLPSSATRHQLLARASVIAHETAHMWFGDLVTMTWFDDVWMKEVFANFMAAKIVEPSFPDLDHDLRFLLAHYPAAYDVDRTEGANPIRQPLANLKDAGSLYGPIVYLKSPIVMRQLELLLGADQLRAALREFLDRHAFAHASWPDLLPLLQRRTTRDLSAWSARWLESSGRPSISATLDRSPDGLWQIELRSSSPNGQRLDVAVAHGQRIDHVPVWLEDEASLRVAGVDGAPEYVLPNGRGLGYGEFVLDRASREWLMRGLPDASDALTRGSAWLTLWDGMLGKRVTPDAIFRLALAALQHEDSELNLQRMLSDVERIFWLFLPDAGREAEGMHLERVLQQRLDAETRVTVKAAVFATLRAVATTPPRVEWLRTIWSGDSQIDGLTLREADYVVLAQELAVRSHSGDDIVHRQLARTENADRRMALAFVGPALSADAATRRAFMHTITKADNRRREPWVIEGMRWLHHPLRARASIGHIRTALDLLEEVKRTGDIFLPKRWLDAMFSGHRSPEAARVVREFLDSRPENYPVALRRMILASADYLFRAARMSQADSPMP